VQGRPPGLAPRGTRQPRRGRGCGAGGAPKRRPRLQAAERLVVLLRLQRQVRQVEVARPVARQVGGRVARVRAGRQRRQRLPGAPVAGAAVQRGHERGARLRAPAPARAPPGARRARRALRGGMLVRRRPPTRAPTEPSPRLTPPALRRPAAAMRRRAGQQCLWRARGRGLLSQAFEAGLLSLAGEAGQRHDCSHRRQAQTGQTCRRPRPRARLACRSRAVHHMHAWADTTARTPWAGTTARGARARAGPRAGRTAPGRTGS